MNYENIRLDKGMYKNERGFSQTLESLDPSRSYSGTELAGLDAYQRQLKRFDIKVAGSSSDCIAKFFQTSDTAALFPEYVSRAVSQGMCDASVVDEIVASKSNINSLDYRSINVDQRIDGNTSATGIELNNQLVKLKKYGRLLITSYEAIKFQRIDLFTVALKQIGAYIAKSMLKDAIEVLLSNCEFQCINGQFAYYDILALWNEFNDFEMNTLLASPNMVSSILTMKELQYVDGGNNLYLSP